MSRPPPAIFGLPPGRFDAELTEIWYEVTDMIPSGVLAKSDRLAVEIVCRLTRKVFRDEINGAELSTLNSLLARLGMTPADRSKVSVPKQAEEQDEIAALAAEIRGTVRTETTALPFHMQRTRLKLEPAPRGPKSLATLSP